MMYLVLCLWRSFWLCLWADRDLVNGDRTPNALRVSYSILWPWDRGLFWPFFPILAVGIFGPFWGPKWLHGMVTVPVITMEVHRLAMRTHARWFPIPLYSVDSLGNSSCTVSEPSPRYCFRVPLKPVINGRIKARSTRWWAMNLRTAIETEKMDL